MIKFKDEFLNIISKEVQLESLDDGLIMKKYYEKIFEAKEDGKW